MASNSIIVSRARAPCAPCTVVIMGHSIDCHEYDEEHLHDICHHKGVAMRVK